ncbi:unnamed protein product, partial [Caenorhabditis auriculariae]
MLTWNLIYTIVGFSLLGNFSVFQITIFALVPVPLTQMFNQSFSQRYGVELSELGRGQFCDTASNIAPDVLGDKLITLLTRHRLFLTFSRPRKKTPKNATSRQGNRKTGAVKKQNFCDTASDIAVSTIFSAITLTSCIAQVLGIFFLLPFFDKRGRKFAVVYLRFFMGMAAGLCQAASGYFVSAELFLLSIFIASLALTLKTAATVLFISECAPNSKRGFATTIVAIGDTLMWCTVQTLSYPAIFGNIERWYYIPIFSIFLCLLFLTFLSRIPESPKKLALSGKYDEA